MNTSPLARDHLPHAARFSPRDIKRAVGQVEGFNAKLALIITRSVGTMACAYLFALIALVSLPAILIQAGVLKASSVPTILTKPGLILVVAWIAQTFIQLVLLSIIMVGQSVQSSASDARAGKEFADTEVILDRLDLNTAGGIKSVLDAIESLRTPAPGSPAPAAPGAAAAPAPGPTPAPGPEAPPASA
jgi:hypothetical protein